MYQLGHIDQDHRELKIIFLKIRHQIHSNNPLTLYVLVRLVN